MRVFVDTSAILALLNPEDASHRKAKEAFDTLARAGENLVTTSYVLVETYALLSRRFGTAAARAFREDFSPLLEVVWVGEELHEAGLDLLETRSSRHLSLVDAVSFAVLRDRSIDRVFAYDDHFRREGFEPV